MATSIDSLQIELTANAVKANDAIDKLSSKIDRLSTSLSKINGGNLTGLANGVNKLATSMQAMKSVGTADFTRLAKNLNNIGTVNTASLNRLASATTQISKSFAGMSGATQGIKTMSDLANGIKQLGYASSTKAITNIPLLATALKQMMATLSTAPTVSQNLINMTNALARLSRTGGAAGTAANSLVRSFNAVPSATSRASKGFTSLAATIGKVYATYWLLFRAFQKIADMMEIASNLTEVENVVNHTFGSMRTKLDDFVSDSIDKFGMSELAAKQFASRFQAMGVAMGISNNSVAKTTEFLNGKLGDSAKIYGDLGGTMADLSVNLTKLTSDYASFFDIAQSDVAEDFQSIFTGQTKPLRQYGLDLTNATLKEWALANGLNANINAMTQAEKAMLRYQYVMANSSHVMGDFARTSDTWHNVITRLKNNFQNLSATVGKAFINLLKPVAIFVNNAIVGLNKVAVAISNALGKLLGWEYEEGSGGMATEYEDAAESADDMASGTGKAAKAAKELKKQLQGIDELNVLTTNNDSGSGSGSGGGTSVGGAGGATGTDGSWVKTSGLFDSDVKTWKDLGNKIRDGLITAMGNIKWNEIYQKAANFGTGLAEFINGLFEEDKNGETVLGSVGKTIAGALKTAIIFAFTLGKGIKFEDIGHAIADFFNKFNEEMNAVDPVTGLTGWQALAETLNTWVDGIKTTIVTAIKDVEWTEVIKGAFDFASGLELDTLAVIIGAFAWKYGGKEIVKGALSGLLKTSIETGIGESTITLGSAIGISILTAVVGFKIGNWIYENTEFSKFADAVAEWMVKENGDISIPKAMGVTLGSLALTIGGIKIAKWIIGGVTSKTTAMAASSLVKVIGADLAAAFGFADVASMSIALGSAAAQLGIAIGVAILGYKIGQKWYEKATGEEIQGGIKDLIDMDVSWSEIGQAISDGAVLDITITPLLKLISGDDTITTQEVIDAGSQMISDIVNGIKNAPGAIVDFFINVKGSIDEKAQQIKDWFTDKTEQVKEFLANAKGKVEDTFTNLKSKWDSLSTTAKDLWANAKGKIEDTFNNLKASWDNLSTAAKDLWANAKGNIEQSFTNLKSTWDDLSTKGKELVAEAKAKGKDAIDNLSNSWKLLTGSVKSIGLKATASATGKAAIDKIKTSWNNLLKSKKVQQLKVTFLDAFTKPLKNAWNSLARLINKGIEGLNKALPSSLKISARIPVFAMGGFPEDGWFRASQGEMMGRFDNGQSVVANNMQITEGISVAVQRGNREMVSYMQRQVAILQQQNDYLYQILQKETGINYKDVFNATRQANKEYKAVNGGISAFI